MTTTTLLVLCVFVLVLCLVSAMVVHIKAMAKYKKKYEHQQNELARAARINESLRARRDQLHRELDDAHIEIYILHDKLAEKQTSRGFTSEQLRVLIQLCHPDKHGGKTSAVEMTKILNSMRG